MIKNIMFGSDGSPYGAVAGEYAFDLADRLDARLEAVHVVDSRRLEPAPMPHAAGCLAWMPPGVSEQLRTVLTERGKEILGGIAEEGENWEARPHPRQKPTPAPHRPCSPRPCTVQVPSQLRAFTPG